jgi:hypothetical protein
MTGTRFGCGIAQWGACTVQIDGEPVRSCLLPVGAIGDRKITTIEGIGETGAGRKLQKAWLDLEVVQCGHCQSGQIISADVLYGPMTAREKAGAVMAELFNTQSVEAGRWPNARTPVARGRRPGLIMRISVGDRVAEVVRRTIAASSIVVLYGARLRGDDRRRITSRRETSIA